MCRSVWIWTNGHYCYCHNSWKHTHITHMATCTLILQSKSRNNLVVFALSGCNFISKIKILNFSCFFLGRAEGGITSQNVCQMILWPLILSNFTYQVMNERKKKLIIGCATLITVICNCKQRAHDTGFNSMPMQNYSHHLQNFCF